MKIILKALKYLIIGIIIILTGAVVYLYIQFNTYKPEYNFSVNSKNLEYYHDSYKTGRMAFLEKANIIQEKFPTCEIFKLNVPSKLQDSLFVDFCYVPGNDSSKLLIFSSGIHGVEGFTGTAMQLYFMDNYITPDFLSGSGLLLIHSMNPYGYNYIRRVTENNVDLNRNSETDPALFSSTNQGYKEIISLINPEKPLKINDLSNRFFFLSAMINIIKKGMPVLRQAVLHGQYEYPKGLYYGGSSFEPQISDITEIIDTICQPYSKVLEIDIHTGYGETGKMHLFPNPVEKETRAVLENIYQGFHIDWGDSKDFYIITGSFADFIGKINKDKEFYPMTYEFGTIGSQTTMGSLKSIHIMVMENQGFQYGYKSSEDSIAVKKELIEMYYPSSDEWKSKCIEDFKTTTDSMLPRFLGL